MAQRVSQFENIFVAAHLRLLPARLGRACDEKPSRFRANFRVAEIHHFRTAGRCLRSGGSLHGFPANLVEHQRLVSAGWNSFSHADRHGRGIRAGAGAGRTHRRKAQLPHRDMELHIPAGEFDHHRGLPCGLRGTPANSQNRLATQVHSRCPGPAICGFAGIGHRGFLGHVHARFGSRRSTSRIHQSGVELVGWRRSGDRVLYAVLPGVS